MSTPRAAILTGSWLESELTIAGRKLQKLSAPRVELLRSIKKNVLFTESTRDQSEIHGMLELIYVISRTTEELLSELKLSPDEWDSAVSMFGLEYESEIQAIVTHIESAMQRLEAAQVESDQPGKQEPALASSPP